MTTPDEYTSIADKLFINWQCKEGAGITDLLYAFSIELRKLGQERDNQFQLRENLENAVRDRMADLVVMRAERDELKAKLAIAEKEIATLRAQLND